MHTNRCEPATLSTSYNLKGTIYALRAPIRFRRSACDSVLHFAVCSSSTAVTRPADPAATTEGPAEMCGQRYLRQQQGEDSKASRKLSGTAPKQTRHVFASRGSGQMVVDRSYSFRLSARNSHQPRQRFPLAQMWPITLPMRPAYHRETPSRFAIADGEAWVSSG